MTSKPRTYHSHGRAIAHLKIEKRGFKDIVDDRAGIAGRSAAGHDIDLTKYLEGGDHLQDAQEGEGPPQARNRDVAELLSAVGAIYFSRVIKRHGYILQAGQENEHAKAYSPPQGRERNHQRRKIPLIQKGNRTRFKFLQESID